MRLTEVLERCHEAAEAIATLPPTAQPGWIVYILEKIEETPIWPRDRMEVLAEVKREIETRLAEGGW